MRKRTLSDDFWPWGVLDVWEANMVSPGLDAADKARKRLAKYHGIDWRELHFYHVCFGNGGVGRSDAPGWHITMTRPAAAVGAIQDITPCPLSAAS